MSAYVPKCSVTSLTLPTTRIGMTVKVDSVDANGDAHISYGYTDAAPVDAGSFGEQQLDAYRTGIAAMSQISGTQTLTPRNEVVDSAVTGTDALGATGSQTVQQFSDQMNMLSVPFPEEGVGVGARWRVESDLHVNSVTVHQTYMVTLRERAGDTVVIDMKLTQHAPRQRAELPAFPPRQRSS